MVALECMFFTNIHLPSSFPHSLVSKEFACSAGVLPQCSRHRFDPWVGKIPWEGDGNPLQCSCLGNSMERGTWWATAHGVARVRHDWATKPTTHGRGAECTVAWSILLFIVSPKSCQFFKIPLKCDFPRSSQWKRGLELGRCVWLSILPLTSYAALGRWLFFFNFILCLKFIILYWFCQTSKWIRHRYTCAPHPEPSSLVPPHTLPLGRPSAPAPSIQYRASNLDWRLVSYILYMFQCHSPKSPHPLPLPQSP